MIGLILGCLAAVGGLAGSLGADDPGSPRQTGSAAIAQLLRDQGVRVERTADVDAAAAALRPTRSGGSGPAAATLVIVDADRLSAEQVTALTGTGVARTVLVRPTRRALAAFGVQGSVGQGADQPAVAPACTDPVALRAGPIAVGDARTYRVPSAVGCYPDENGDSSYVQLQRPDGRLDLAGNPFANDGLDTEGNASFALGVLGSQPTVVWLMTPVATTAGAADSAPGLLPTWWPAAVVQALIALTVLAVWRGRRLGPIIAERLPVLVRAGETVEGHGRLYQRLDARDRAAAALRAGVIARLGPRFGSRVGSSGGSGAGTDPLLLARQLADRTGREPAQVADWLTGPTPADDDALNALAHDLDRLEQEARQL